MVLNENWLQRALPLMLATVSAALALGCSGNVPTSSEASPNSEHRGGHEESNDVDAADDSTTDGQALGAQDQAPTAEAVAADETITSNWNCYGRNGRFFGRVGIWWGNTATDGTWACNEWKKSECSAAGGCVASGSLVGAASCNVNDRVDGCSNPLNDPISNTYKGRFLEACNAHDLCYHAPWDRISNPDAGFKTCNDQFWDDMNAICGGDVGCRFVASNWGTAMNVEPGRVMFWSGFVKDQVWKDNTCLR